MSGVGSEMVTSRPPAGTGWAFAAGVPGDSPGATGWVMALDKLAAYAEVISGR
jgi:hypothetical protein